MRTKEAARTASKKSTRFPQHRRLLLELGLRFGLGALFSQGLLLGRHVPFALGWVAASGSGPGGAAALCGTLLGFLLGMNSAEALRYSAAAVLIFAAAFACLDQKLSRNPWFMPLCAGAAAGMTGVLYLSGTGWSRTAVVGILSEILLTALSCLLFRGSDFRERPAPEGLLFLVSVLTICVCRAHIAAGGTLAALATLAAARIGAGAGALAGGCTGLAAGLTTQGTPLLGVILSFAGGMTGGFSRRQGRLGAVLLFAGSGLLAAAWVHAGVPAAQSIALGAAIFSALPEKLLRRCDALLHPARRATGTAAEPLPSSVARVRFRLEEQAIAFQSLYEHIHESVLRGEPPESSSSIFDRVAERVCRGCSLDPVCWRREHTATCQALTQALETMLERGSSETADYPLSFRNHCMNLEKFVCCANEELHSYWNRQQYRKRMKNNRLAVCRQYVQLSSLLASAARELEEEQERDPSGAAAAERALIRLGVKADCSLCIDARGRRTLEVRGNGLTAAAEQGGAAVSQALGVRMETADICRIRRGQRLVFRQTPPLAATVAVAAKEKRSGQASGDNGIWFRDGEGILWVALCDGMGSGAEAARESRLLLTLLKDFLHAGVEPLAALETLTGALSLRDELDGGFTTVDLLRLDLFSGATELYKLGGAPTYLRKGGQVSRLTGSALPAGLELDQPSVPDMTRFRLGAGDLVLLLTDGITDGQEDSWLKSMLAGYRGESPRELAQAVLASPAVGREDDRTVVAIRVSERG